MKKLLAILSFVTPLISFGQLTTNVVSPASGVQNTLLGSGVTVSNITYSGTAAAIGTFNAAGTNLGLQSGLMMTTGTVLNTGDGPHGPNNKSGSGVDNGQPGFGLLSGIGGAQTYNAAILQFDFVPYSDEVEFRYVFGSEEYPEYVGSTFNDAFAFYISGPGITGNQNMALLPSGQTVTINNVNAGLNAAFFVNNGNGTQAPFNGSANYIQYDGFTKVLTAKSDVLCGQTYHLIIAIADTGDGILDSGIFLEANSLTSDTPVDISHVISQELFGDNTTVAESCVETTVTLTRGQNEIASVMTIPLIVSGTAIEGVDYTTLPNPIVFPAGVASINFSFTAFNDGLIEGSESLTLEFPIMDPCGNINPIVLNLTIEDMQAVGALIDGGTMNCPGEDVILTATPTGGAPPYTYLWNTGETTQSITVAPSTTTSYSVDITDACLLETDNATYEVVVPVFPPLILAETGDITEICPYIPATLEANPSGGSGNYTYQWSSTFEPNSGTESTLDVLPWTTTTYIVTVTDNCGTATTEDVLYTITSPPLVLTMSPTVEICPGDSIQISVSAVGGYGDYYYNWFHSGESTPSVWVSPDVTTSYTVSVSDECQTFTVEGTTEVIVIKPTANFTTTSTVFFNDLPITFENLSENAITYEWEFGDGNSSTFNHPSNTYDEPGEYFITLVAIDEKGCTDTITKPILIEEEWWIYVPNTFTPDGDRVNNDFRASTIGIQQLSIAIYNRWGETVFTSSDREFIWDGTYEGIYVTDGSYTYKIEFITNSGRERKLLGHINVLR